MFNYLQGILKIKKPEYIVVDVQGVGYQIYISLSTFEKIGNLETKIKILVYLYFSTSKTTSVFKLYGFLNQEEKDLFNLLISISGIGPRVALTILSKISIEKFHKAILEEDYQILTTIPSIGRKTAQRIILELKGKIDFPFSEEKKSTEEDVLSALISLGYKRQVAQKVVKKVLLDKKERTLEDFIRDALKHI